MSKVNPSSSGEMSLATQEVLSRVRLMIPPMLGKFHKGAFPLQGGFPRRFSQSQKGHNG